MSDDSIDKMLSKIASKFTPEYFENLKISSYKQDRAYPENFSNWYPHIKSFGKFKHANIISNQILTLNDIELLKEEHYDNVNFAEIRKVLQPTIDKMTPYKAYSLKNGCFSNKFEFNTSMVTDVDIAENLWKINYASSMLDTGGYTEVVVRELIPYNQDTTPTIYNGMPLRTELRVFYNMQTHKIEYVADYWDYDYCYRYLHLTDKIVFDWFNTNTNRVKNLKYITDYVYQYINTLEFDDMLTGIWGIDFMLCEDVSSVYDGIYLIDMARGFRSAYWDYNLLSEEGKQLIDKER